MLTSVKKSTASPQVTDTLPLIIFMTGTDTTQPFIYHRSHHIHPWLKKTGTCLLKASNIFYYIISCQLSLYFLQLYSFYPILLPSIPLPISFYCPSTTLCSPLFLFRSPFTVLLPHSTPLYSSSALLRLSFYPILLPSIPLTLSFYCPSTPFCSPLFLFRSPSTVLLPHSAPLYSTSALLLLSFYPILLPSIPLPLSFYCPSTPFCSPLFLFRSPSTGLLPHSAPLYSTSPLLLLSFYHILLPSIPLPLSFYCPSTPFCSHLFLFRSPSTVLLPHSAPLYSSSALLLLSFYPILLPSIPLPLTFYCPSTPFCSPLIHFRSLYTVFLPHSAPLYSSSALLLLSFYPILLPSIPLPLSFDCPSTPLCSPLFLFRYPPIVLLPHSAPLYSSSALVLLSFYPTLLPSIPLPLTFYCPSTTFCSPQFHFRSPFTVLLPHYAPLYSSSALLLLSFYPILLPSIPLPLSFDCPSTPFCSPLFLFGYPLTVLLPHSAPLYSSSALLLLSFYPHSAPLYSSSALLLLSFYPILIPSIPLPLSFYCPSTPL